MNDKEFNKYLGIANHDIQVANNHEELKSYVASILYELNNLQSNWNSLREFFENGLQSSKTFKESDAIYEDSLIINKVLEVALDKMNELEGKDNNE